MRIYLFQPLLLLILLTLPVVSEAQFSLPAQPAANLSLSPSATSPTPGDTVQLTLSGATAELVRELRWYVNGQYQADWQGNTAPRLFIDDLTRRTVEVRRGGRPVARSFITPAYIDIVIEPLTYVPPHYTGRPLPSMGSRVRLVALVEEAGNISPSDYQYTWRLGGRVVGGGMIEGNNQLFITMPSTNPGQVSVTVSRRNAGVLGERTAALPTVQPQLVFYPVHTLYGLRSQGYTNSFPWGTQSTLTLQAAPFYVPTQAFSNTAATQIDWSLDGEPLAATDSSGMRVSLQRSQLISGGSVRFSLFNQNDWRQSITGRLRITDQ